jgi:hypothetical protein
MASFQLGKNVSCGEFQPLSLLQRGLQFRLIIFSHKPLLRVFGPIYLWLDKASPVDAIVGVILIPAGFLYCCCRIFLVVEAFISIRDLPIDAYKTPEWTQFLLHL